MDWFSWLSKTSLEPSLVYEYGLAFAHNELEEDDIAYFNHEFLQSMGISIAKHRLEILKLARKEKGVGKKNAMRKLVEAIKKTKKNVARCIHRWVRREESSAIVVVPKVAYGSRWKGAMLKRNKKLMMVNQGRLMLTNGTPKVAVPPPPVSTGVSPLVDKFAYVQDKVADENEAYWSTTGVEEIRWDAMFQNLKPT
ncbi:hypothetical protein Sjap_011052 [Stephania japonica]|uniref:SAM domain-containing protein n=1 Tax=Stephania japonica TaxID=461633 RepID=A0AAP0JBN0_9MAGN